MVKIVLYPEMVKRVFFWQQWKCIIQLQKLTPIIYRPFVSINIPHRIIYDLRIECQCVLKCCGPRLYNDIRLIQVKKEGWTRFSKGWQGCSEGFLEGKSRGNPEKQPCQPEENPVHRDSFRGSAFKDEMPQKKMKQQKTIGLLIFWTCSYNFLQKGKKVNKILKITNIFLFLDLEKILVKKSGRAVLSIFL